MTKILIALIAIAAGIASAVQAAANAGLSSRIGLGAALMVNTSIVLAGTLVFYFARGGQHGSFFPEGTPWSLYIGGVCGFIIILSLAFVLPKIGAAVTITLVVLGQGIAALLIDHFGLMGMPKEPVTFTRVVGMLLIGSGIACIRI